MISKYVKEIIDTSTGDVPDRSGLIFNHHKTIDKTKAYRNGQYYERKTDAIFWELGQHRAQHFSKNIDLDTQDLMPYGVGDVSFVQVWILRMKMYRWFEDNQYALRMDELADELADFGSAIIKRLKEKGKTKVELCDLSNVYFNPLVRSLRDDCDGIVELHYLTKNQLEQKKNVWENVDKLTPEKDGTFIVWEFVGTYDGKYTHAIGQGYNTEYVPLFEEVIKKEDNPYHDFHIGAYKGTWLRRGVYQRLFRIQERANELVNRNAETQLIAATILLRSNNPDLDGNVLTDVETGDIINDTDLQQIQIDNRAINGFIQEMQMIENQADKAVFTPEVITGDNLPSGTPFRSIATISSAAKSTFKKIRQYYGEQMGYFLKGFIFPEVVKDWNSKELVEIARDELDVRIYDQQLRKLVRWRTFVDNLLAAKVVDEVDLLTAEKQIEATQDTRVRKITLPKNFFNFDYHIRTNITDEQGNKQTMNDAMYNALQMVQANPAIVNTPLFRQYVENNGINHWRLTPEQVDEIKQGATIGAKEPMGTKPDQLLAAAEA